MARRRAGSRAAVDLVALERTLERDACVDHLRFKMESVGALAKRGRIGAEACDLLKRCLDAIADEIGQGLHR